MESNKFPTWFPTMLEQIKNVLPNPETIVFETGPGSQPENSPGLILQTEPKIKLILEHFGGAFRLQFLGYPEPGGHFTIESKNYFWIKHATPKISKFIDWFHSQYETFKSSIDFRFNQKLNSNYLYQTFKKYNPEFDRGWLGHIKIKLDNSILDLSKSNNTIDLKLETNILDNRKIFELINFLKEKGF